MNEFQTRFEKIDPALKRAGWDDYEVIVYSITNGDIDYYFN